MISELIHHGQLSANSKYAEIEAELILINEGKHYQNLKGFIDTGASKSAIHVDVVNKDLDLSSYETVQNRGANGSYDCVRINNVGIILPSLNAETYTGTIYIDTTTMNNGYDIIIGCDVLSVCEFIYNGRNGTYQLKYLKEA